MATRSFVAEDLRKILAMSSKVLLIAVVPILVVAVATLWFYRRLEASLPQLEGEVAVAGLSHPVLIERDHLGVPTISGIDRSDVSTALGFLHAQDRFFQMDLYRRRGAGELAELLGPGLIPADRDFRKHRFRARAERMVADLSANHRALAQAYTDGVNAGLNSLGAAPFEYLLLRVDPEPWRLEDMYLVAFSMYLELNDDRARFESARGLVYDLLGPEMFEFLFPIGTRWDAPIDGSSFDSIPIPQPAAIDLRDLPPVVGSTALSTHPLDDLQMAGSNNWAISGRLTAHGGAILANDMHLSHSVPNIWYRASLSYSLRADRSTTRQVTGVSLPGSPFIIAGSNGSVAWGHTNTYGDWQDLVVLDRDPEESETYSTPKGPVPFGRFEETLRASDGTSEILEVVETIWGPVVDRDHRDRPRALRWIAHDPTAVTFALLEVEESADVGAALDAANRMGAPPQNFVAADRHGDIGWTVMGPIPRRFGFDGRLPSSWHRGDRGWGGYLDPEEYPRALDPELDRIWTANARVVGDPSMSLIGVGDYRLGARASQIRDVLATMGTVDEADLLELQLDDRALFLTRWKDLLVEVLTNQTEDENRAILLREAEDWGGRASIDSVGYRAVREFRRTVAAMVMGSLTAPCNAADPRFDYTQILQYEQPLWKIVSEQPAHLLDSSFQSWKDLFLAAADRVVARLQGEGGRLGDATWGQANSVRIRHPLSPSLPLIGQWLDMKTVELPGDSNMPRFQSRSAGASQRFVVSPGREGDGVFHMPTGQSGHPLSPHYGDGQMAWVVGAPTPFLPESARATLVLVPD